MEKGTKHYTLASFIETTKPLIRAELAEEYPNLNMDYYDDIADMYFYVLSIMAVKEITAMANAENPTVNLINHKLRKYGMWITKNGIIINF